MKKLSLLFLSFVSLMTHAQKQLLTPEKLWELGRISVQTATPDGSGLLYSISRTNLTTEKSNTTQYMLDMATWESVPTVMLKGKQFVQWDQNGLYALNDGSLFVSRDKGATWSRIHSGLKDATNVKIAPDGKTIAFSKSVRIEKVKATAKYNDVPNSTAYIYNDLDIRHWDYWNDGTYSHIFLTSAYSTEQKDIMKDEPFYAPQVPFGGAEDFVFSKDSKTLLYVCKKAKGKAYAQSTNTDIYAYSLKSGHTDNWTKGMMGYDTKPLFSPDGKYVSWTSMARDGYEADKVDLYIMDLSNKKKVNLTNAWDETVDGDYIWSTDSRTLYFSAAYRGTQQLFSIAVNEPGNVHKITDGTFDIAGVIGQFKKDILVSRTDMNHSAELYAVNTGTGKMTQLSHANDDVYEQTEMCSYELRMVSTADRKRMGVWVVYPPNFDKTKKYPTLLYCQGGPQSALTQFYSVRWNFALMAAKGYIVVAPNRRGMPGWGTEWNEAISQDWGGRPMQDYLAAIDDVAKESYVDKNRLGCVGASYGGYSVFMLAGIHNNRFKTFIAHDGLFDMKSWYGTTEELWFANWDLGGNYWQKDLPKAYGEYNPSNYIDKWNTPIMVIQGGIDFRVPIEQGLQAFQAAQLKGIKSKLLYLPDENHWVLHPHNGLVWQREFFSWLQETLK